MDSDQRLQLVEEALQEAAELSRDLIAVLGCRALNGEELTIYRQAERLLEKLETTC